MGHEGGSRAHLGNKGASSHQQAAESEIGPAKLVADALGIDAGKVVAISIASIFDALCVLLLIAASSPKRPAVSAPAEPATLEPTKAAPRKSNRRSAAARRGWANRKRKQLIAKAGKPIERVK